MWYEFLIIGLFSNFELILSDLGKSIFDQILKFWTIFKFWPNSEVFWPISKTSPNLDKPVRTWKESVQMEEPMEIIDEGMTIELNGF